MRSADNCIGVNGFLISCASRRATSPHAASRCACNSAVMSSNTITKPAALSSSPGSAVQAQVSTRRPTSPRNTICSRHSVSPASRWTQATSTNCSISGIPLATSLIDSPALLSRLTPRIEPEASLAVRIFKSDSRARTPVDSRAKMTSRLVRSASIRA